MDVLFASLTQDPRVTDTALVVVAIYFGVNLLLAVAWGMKSYLDRRERNRREMHAYLDKAYRDNAERKA
jgi:hypothetical protein